MRKKMMFVASAFLLLASCSSNDNPGVSTKLENELGVSVNVKSATRATGETTSFATSSAVGLFVDGVAAGTYIPKIAAYTFGGTTWSGPTNGKIYLSGNDANVYGFFPSTATVATDTKIMNCEIPASQSFTAAEADDYMYSVTESNVLPVVSTKSTGTTTAALFFHHVLSKVSFIVNKSADYPIGNKAGVVSKIELKGTSKFSIDGTVSLATGVFTPGTTKVDALTLTGPANSNEYSSTASQVVTAYGLFAPCSNLSGINLTFTIDGTNMAKSLTIANVSKWESGNNYIYTVTVLPTELQITCAIVPWILTYEDLGNIQ